MGFRHLTSQKALVFQATTPTLTVDDVKNCQIEIEKMKDLFSVVLLDLSKVEKINDEILALLADMGNRIISQKHRLMVMATTAMTKVIKDKGYSEYLPCYIGIAPLTDEIEGTAPPKIQSQIIMDLATEALKENIKIYSKLEIEFGQPFVADQKTRPPIDLAGVGGFFCDNKKGNLMLCFSTDIYLKVVSAIMKREYTSIEPQVRDWAAELVNSILGRVKTELKKKHYSFSTGIPAVFMGKDLEVLFSSRINSPIDVIPCKGEFGEFFLNLILTDVE